MFKTCIECKKTKDTKEFYWRKAKNSYYGRCKPCLKIQVYEIRRKNPSHYESRYLPNLEKIKIYAKTPRGREVASRASAKSYINHKEKWQTRAKTIYAIKMGILVKPEKCEHCEFKGAGRKIQAHHTDYSKPLKVIFLCTQCHAKAHKLLKAKAPSPKDNK